jgi:hypothetical protein
MDVAAVQTFELDTDENALRSAQDAKRVAGGEKVFGGLEYVNWMSWLPSMSKQGEQAWDCWKS